MRVVTREAVFCYRRVFPKIGAANIGMASLASIVNGLSHEQQLGGAAVRVVAATAVHLALPDRMRVRLHRLRALLLMAFETHLGLRRSRQHRIPFRMRGMAVRTRYGIFVVTAAVPGETGVVLMTPRAKTVLLRDRRHRPRTKLDHRRTFLTASYTARMIATRAVAGFALQLAVAERRIRITRHAVLAAEHRKNHLVLMTSETGVRALAAI